MKSGNLEFRALQQCRMRFDGGSVFGHVPKVVWEQFVTSDQKNRVLAGCNTILIRMHGKNILTDVGMGTKWNQKELGLYALTPLTAGEMLAPHGLKPEDIDLILLSHLHIDHAGGLTKLNGQGEVELAYPNAMVYVQKGEWEAANRPDPRSRPSYREWDFRPVYDAGKLKLLDGNTELFPGCDMVVTGGHTANHQIVVFQHGEEKVIFTADIFPTSVHLKPHWCMGYDLFPLGVMEARQQLLPALEQKNVSTVFGHDPRILAGRIFRNDLGKYECEALEEVDT